MTFAEQRRSTRAGRQYRAVIFDLDGTLVDSFPAIHRSLAVAMQATGLPPWDLATTTRHVGRGIEHLVTCAVGEERKQRALEVFLRDYGENCLDRTVLHPGVAATLARLKEHKFRLAVATNKSIHFTRRIVDHLGIAPAFDCVAGPELVPRLKPHPDMIRFIRGRLGVEARECLYVGDMPLDAETAAQAGVDCLLVATGAQSRPELERFVQAPVLERFADIPVYLGVDERSGCGPGGTVPD